MHRVAVLYLSTVPPTHAKSHTRTMLHSSDTRYVIAVIDLDDSFSRSMFVYDL